jgi:AcrR family transcriptional regulator
MRKEVKGEFRNKEATKEKLLNAVGTVIKNDGYTKLGINNIARAAGVDKRLIYRYFGDVDILINTYIKKRDYWTSLNNDILQSIDFKFDDFGKGLATDFLKQLLAHLDDYPETQKVILWEISEKSKIMSDISRERELMGEGLFKMTDPHFEGSEINIRACYSVLLAGVYYLKLHSNATGGKFCEMDLKNINDQEAIQKSIEQMIGFCYDAAGKRS